MLQFLRDYLAERRLNRRRLVTKNGHCNIAYGSVRYSHRFIYFIDLWTTLMETRWRFIIFHFGASYVLSWFIFGLFWYWVAFANGDLWYQYQPFGHNVCVLNMVDITGAFLTSIEALMSIGYGYRLITPYCPSAITLLTVECVYGTMIICFWSGVIMTKIARPKKRSRTIKFSKVAVICAKQNRLCLLIRVANMRKSLMIDNTIFGKMLKTTVTPEGETIVLDQISIDFNVVEGKDKYFFVCPLTLCHVIDESSPFFKMTVDTLQQQNFEMVVFLHGTAESTSSSCQVRTSYIPKEIIWGYEFLPIITRSKGGKYRVNFSNFEKVAPVETPPDTSRCAKGKDHHHSSADTDSEGIKHMEDQFSACYM